MKARRAVGAVLIGLALLAVGGGVLWWRGWLAPGPRLMSPEAYETYARERFAREHPGEKPLRLVIGETAERFYRARPMGKFVLSLRWGQWGNDCSDFVECVVDEALGVGARFKRGSQQHLVGTGARFFGDVPWDRVSPLLPGDILAVAHSPWYRPYEGANWHVGIVGADGQVYDFVKLKRWPEARYGRNSVRWFVRHATGPDEVTVGRLRPEYCYKLREVVPGGGHY